MNYAANGSSGNGTAYPSYDNTYSSNINNNNHYYYYSDGQHTIEELPEDACVRHGDLLPSAAPSAVENEEEAAPGEGAPRGAGGPTRPQLHIDLPLGATARELADGRGPADAVTAALLRQLEQQRMGRPRSPLSPQTLQRWALAAQAGLPFDPSPADILEAVPLALTWHGMGPGEEGEAVGHKRLCRHADDAAELPPAKRARAEGGRAATMFPTYGVPWAGQAGGPRAEAAGEDGGGGRKRARE